MRFSSILSSGCDGSNEGGYHSANDVNLLGDKNSTIAALPPIHWNSSWIERQWIPPPGYITYSTQKIQSIFSKHSVLVVGDSTARRQFGTWYGLLNTSNPNDLTAREIDWGNIIDVNKKNQN